MTAAAGIINEVETALHGASSENRVEVLRRVTDLFVGDAARFSSEQAELFDGVLGHLINHIESRAIVELSSRLAPISQAPLGIVGRLARSDDVAIAGPILAQSERLTDDDLVQIAATKSQAHLATIAMRRRVSETVTDALVDHGDAIVANQLAINSGARFSSVGMAKLVMRADGDDELTESIGQRSDISPHLYRQLVAQATETVRARLLANSPAGRQDAIRQVIADISAQVTPKGDAIHRYRAAQRTMRPFGQDTELLKRKILEFANLRHMPEVVAGLSMLGGTPIERIDRLFHTANGFGLMVFCKSMALDWQTSYVVITTAASEPLDDAQLEELRQQFVGLSVSSAQRVLRFWHGRQNVKD